MAKSLAQVLGQAQQNKPEDSGVTTTIARLAELGAVGNSGSRVGAGTVDLKKEPEFQKLQARVEALSGEMAT